MKKVLPAKGLGQVHSALLLRLGAEIRAKAKVLRWAFRRGIRLAKSPFRDFLFRARVALRGRSLGRVASPRSLPKIASLSDLAVSYISLEARDDRRAELLPEFSRMGLQHALHFVAIKRKNGALGCAESHHAILDGFRQSQRLLMVCEDDISFRLDSRQLLDVVRRFAEDRMLDVLQLDIRTRSKLHSYNEVFNLSNNSNSTGCYILKPHAVDVLRVYFEESITRLRKGQSDRKAAIDVVWTKAQQSKLIFATPIKRVVIHKSGHSDIVGSYMKLDT